MCFFHLMVENTGTAPAAAVVGGILGSGTRLLTRATLLVRRNAGTGYRLISVHPTAIRPAGRSRHGSSYWLAAGRTRSLFRPATSVSMPDHIPDGFANPARVQMQLETRDIGSPVVDALGLASVPVWVGILTTGWIDVPGSCMTR